MAYDKFGRTNKLLTLNAKQKLLDQRMNNKKDQPENETLLKIFDVKKEG